MREEITRDEYFDRDEANEAVQWTSDIAGELVEMGFRVTQMTLQSLHDESGMIVIRYHSRVSGWREVDQDDEPSLADAFDMKLTPYTSMITLGDRGFPVGSFGLYGFEKSEGSYPATAADLDARDHFASEVRALHPTQEDRIETALREVNARLGDDRIDLVQRIDVIEKKLNHALDILEYHHGMPVPEVKR